jgi:hypothetical protein
MRSNGSEVGVGGHQIGSSACAERDESRNWRHPEIAMAQDDGKDYGRDYSRDYLHLFFGGPPVAVIGRLILISILVGVILAAIGLDPWNVIESVRRLLLHIWDMGFDTVRWLWQYFLLGAVIVLPIWFLVRLTRVPRGR